MKQQTNVCSLQPPSLVGISQLPGIVLSVFAIFWLSGASPAAAADAEQSPEAALTDSDKNIGKSAKEILSAPEFRHLHQLKTDLQDNAEKNLNSDENRHEEGHTFRTRYWSGRIGGAIGIVLQILAWSLLSVICVLIVFLIARAVGTIRGRDRSAAAETASGIEGEALPELAPGEIPADVYVSRASELAGQHRYGEAVGQLLLGAMSRIERAGLVRFRRGFTYRDYLRAVGAHELPCRALKSLVSTYEPIGFGRRVADRAEFERSLSDYEAGFRAPFPKLEN